MSTRPFRSAGCAPLIALLHAFAVLTVAAENPPNAFPALGASAPRRVEIAWNQYYDTEGLRRHMEALHEAFPKLTKLYSLGKSVEGRDLWCLEVTAPTTTDPGRKAGMYIDGNIHGNEVQAAEAVLYTAWYLLHQYGRLPLVTELLDERVFYLVPTENPDGRDHWFHAPHTAHSSRTGVRPVDNDRDGTADEDDLDDIDGDGAITMMRIRDPNGRMRIDPDFPDLLMKPAPPDEPGEYRLLGYEGIDNDGDGRVNEDGIGGYDGNRNWPFDWQPNYIQYGAQDYPLSLPEARAVADFALSRPNIAAMQSYHNYGGMILRGPGREGGELHDGDEQVLRRIAERGEAMLPFYKSMIIWKELYTVWGGEVDWFYGGLGVMSFTNEMWTNSNLYREDKEPDEGRKARFIRHVLLEDGLVRWHPFDHPQFGPIEIGGMKKEWSRTPPSFLLEEECHRNMAFTLFHAQMMPLLRIAEVRSERIGERLHKIRVTIENKRMIPSRTEQAVKHHIGPPDIVTVTGSDARVLASGRVTDPYFKLVEPVERRPERLEIDTVPGMGAVNVQFIIEGSGRIRVTVDSAKGGLTGIEHELP